MGPVRHLDIHLTHRCNLRCSYCYAGGQPRQLPPDLSDPLADRAVDFLFDHCHGSPRLRIDLWGGEPFLRRDLIERIARRAHARAQQADKLLRMVIPTNVTLLDAAARQMIRDLELHISLSLDGGPDGEGGRRTADGRSAWKLIGPRLEEILADPEMPPPPVRMTVIPQRAAQLQQDLGYLLARGFRQIAFLPASGARWSEDSRAELDHQLDLVADHFVDWIKTGRPHPPYYSHLLRRLTVLWVDATAGTTPRRAGNCGAGTTLLAVDTRGDLYPCHRVVAQATPPPELKLGSLVDGVTNTALQQRLASISADNPAIRCADCPERAFCGALCPALNFRRTGDVAEVPDEACFVNQRLTRTAQRIHAALVGEPNYRDYIEPFLQADPDERLLPLLAALDADGDSMLDEIGSMLGGLDEEEER